MSPLPLVAIIPVMKSEAQIECYFLLCPLYEAGRKISSCRHICAESVSLQCFLSGRSPGSHQQEEFVWLRGAASSKHCSERPGCVPCASLPGWRPAGWCLGQAGLCIPARHPTLSWQLEGLTSSLGHLLGVFCWRSCCVQHASIQAACGAFSFIPDP